MHQTWKINHFRLWFSVFPKWCVSNTAEYFVRTHGPKLFVDLMNAICLVAFGVQPSRVSLLYLLVYTHRADLLTNFLGTTVTGAQRFRIQGGSQQICQKWRDLIGEETILFEHAVNKVSYGDTWTFERKTKKVFRAKRFIVSISPQQAGLIKYWTPECKRQLLSSFPMGNLIKSI